MNIQFKLNDLYKRNAVNPNENKNKSHSFGKTGDLVSALIMDKTNEKTTLKIKDGQSFDVPKNSIKGEIGDEVFFEIVSTSNDSVQLKQLEISGNKIDKAIENQIGVRELQDLMTKADFIEPEGSDDLSKTQKEQNAKEQRKAIEAMNRIKRQIDYVINNSSRTAVGQLIASGISLDKISLELLNNIVREIEINPLIETAEDVADEKILEMVEQMLQKSAGKIKDSENIKTAGFAVGKHNMPVNEKNVNSVDSALKKFDDVKKVNDKIIASMIEGRKDLTLENLYIAKYSAGNSAEEMPDELFDYLIPQIDKAFEREGIDKTDENYSAAKLLIENDLELTNENVNKVTFLRNLDKYVDEKAIADAASFNVKEGKNASNINLTRLSDDLAADFMSSIKELEAGIEILLQDIPEIVMMDERRLHKMYRENIPFTLGNLQKELRQGKDNTHDTIGNQISKENTNYIIENQKSQEAVTAKRQLMEIAIRLTREASIRLAGKNIKIDTMPLENVLETLNKEEELIYSQNLRAVGAEASHDNVQKMSMLFSEINNFAFTGLIKDVVGIKPFISIRSIGSGALKIIEHYDEITAVPNAKWGDSFKKAEHQMSGVLEALGFETTEENIRAAKILSLNNMEITDENLINVKNIDAKISKIYRTLHPLIAAKMIKEGNNPSTMNIDKIIDYIDSFNGQYGENTGDKLAKYIIEMDKSNVVSEQNRSAIIAVYKMLNQIEKNGGVAFGTTLKADGSLTLGSLMEMSKIFQKTRGNRSAVDENVANDKGLSETFTPEQNILTQINKAYNDSLVERFVDAATPPVFDRVISKNYNNTDLFMEVPVETLIAELDQAKAILEKSNKAEADRMISRMRQMQDAPVNAIRFMQNNNIPLTISNIDIMKTLLKKSNFTEESLNELREADSLAAEIIDSEITDTDLTALKEGKTPEMLTSAIQDKLSEILINSESGTEYEKIDAVKRAMAMQSAVARAGSSNSIPIRMNGRVTEMNLFIVNDNIDAMNGANILMALDTQLGKMNIFVEYEDTEANITFSVENQNTADLLLQNIYSLTNFVEEAGFNVKSVRFSVGENKNMFSEIVNAQYVH